MKKLFSFALIMTLLAGCAGNKSETTTTEAPANTDGEDKVRVALLLPYIGDQSYFDVTYNSFKLINEKYGDKVETELIEMGTDEPGWASANIQAAEEGYDVIISGNFQYESYMLEQAANHPEITYINFDYSDADANKLENVYGVAYKAEDAGYLAGVVAAVKSETGTVGAIGGMEINGIKQFLGGFIQGALAVNPDIKILTGFIGDFQDTGKAKEIALNMNKQGADIIYHAAGGAGNGLFEAASEAGFYAIGVDTDQYASLIEKKPELANSIITSTTKNCDITIFKAIEQYLEGNLATGTLVAVGYAEDGIGLAENDHYKEVLTEEEQAEVAKYAQQLKNGEVKVINVAEEIEQWDELIKQINN